MTAQKKKEAYLKAEDTTWKGKGRMSGLAQQASSVGREAISLGTNKGRSFSGGSNGELGKA